MGHDVVNRGAYIESTMGTEHWDWFNQHVPVLWVEDSRGIVARLNGELAAGCVYDNWTPNSVQCHLVIANPMVIRHGWLQTIFRAAFGVERKYIYGLIPGDNDKALRLNTRMGFTEKCRLDEGFAPGIDYVLMEIKRENCRYL